MDSDRRLECCRNSIRHWRSGIIDTCRGRLVCVRRRWCGRRISWLRAKVQGRWWHHWRSGDRCRLYYYQPLSIPDYLALSFVVSTRQTRLATFRRALTVLDEIARIKGSWAIVCQPMNLRISDRLLRRWGWEPHCPGERGRHYIKRFGQPFRWSDKAERDAAHAIEPLADRSIRFGIDHDVDAPIGGATGGGGIGGDRMVGSHRQDEELIGR